MGEVAPERKVVGERERETSMGFGPGTPEGENSGGVEVLYTSPRGRAGDGGVRCPGKSKGLLYTGVLGSMGSEEGRGGAGFGCSVLYMRGLGARRRDTADGMSLVGLHWKSNVCLRNLERCFGDVGYGQKVGERGL